MHVNVAILGLDRLGTSFGLALKTYEKQPKAEHSFTIYGSDPQSQAMKAAKQVGAVDDFHRQLLKVTANADLILMNVPFGALEEMYTRLGPEIKPGAVILDTSLLKGPAIEWAGRHLPSNSQGEPLAYMVGITPVVNVNGLYHGGNAPEDARADLFEKAEFMVAPAADCPSEAIALAEDVIRLMGGTVRFMDPVEHDGLIAATEQLPALLGVAQFFMLQNADAWMEFRRMINPTMALAAQTMRFQKAEDMQALFTLNRDNVVRHLEGLIGLLDQLRDALVAEEPDELEAFLVAAHKNWEQWDIKRHSGNWEDHKDPELLPGPFGSVSGFLSLTRRNNKDDDEE
ncbi:MAG: prephenate dehydrogenase [Chloroflexi bacterium]|nr:prephenate dehydrogenase [Chloroflexota bacterium]